MPNDVKELIQPISPAVQKMLSLPASHLESGPRGTNQTAPIEKLPTSDFASLSPNGDLAAAYLYLWVG
jgi:hypothetical protein